MSASELARKHTERAIETLAEVMEDTLNDANHRVAAANSLLDRGHGKAAQAIIAVPASRQQQALLAGMSDDDLMKLLRQATVPRLAPIEATFQEIDPLLL